MMRIVCPGRARRAAEHRQLAEERVGTRDRGVRRDETREDLRHEEHVRIERAAAGAPILELARVMGTSIEMIERHYGTLLDGSAAGFAARLDAHDAERDRATAE